MHKLCDQIECPLYNTKRVKYRGDTKDVSIVFVLESPNLSESDMGSLLIGEPGDVFWNEITRAGLGNYSAFVATAAMCHIPKEDGLKIKEVNTILNNCRCHLERAIKTLKPKLIVTMGALSSQQLIKMKTLGDKRGTFIWSEEFNCYVFPTYDPYYCTKKPSAASLFAADLRRVKTFLIGGEVVIEDKEIIVERRESISDIISSSKVVAVDTETQGLDYINPSGIMVSYSVSNDPRKAYQVFLHEECKEEEADFSINWERGKGKARKWTKVFVRKCSNFETKVKELGELLANENIKKVFMNVKYDLHHIAALFKNNGFGELNLQGVTLDCRDIGHCVDENLYARATLEFLRKSFTTLNTQYSDEFDAAFDKSDMLAIPQDQLTKYAASDACVTYNVAMGVTRALKQEPNYERILFYYKNMVMPVTNRVLYEMEKNGITINMALLPSVKEDLRKELDYLYMKIMASIPHSIKDRYVDKRTPEAPLTKTNMIRDMLYTKEGFNIKPLLDKKTKLPNTSIEKKTRTLLLATKLSAKAQEFLFSYDRWKMIDTLLSRYIKGIEKATRLDGKIHSSFSLSVAATGRSCLAKYTHIRTKTENSNFLLKNIQDIKPGDVVFSYDTHWEKIINTKVKWAGKTGDKVKTIDVIFSSKGGQAAGGHIRCTPEHLVYVKDRGYVPAIEVNPGDDLISSEADVYYCKVEKIIIDHKLVDVYDLTIDGPPNFIANGVCVHNSSQGPNLQNIPKRGPLAKVIRKLFVASPGYTFVSADASQCLVPETKLYTIDGIKTLQEVIEKKHPVLSLSKDYDFEFKDIVNGWCSGENEVFEIKLENGESVVATAQHKFYDFYGNIKTVGELRAGDRLLHTHLNYMDKQYPEISLGLVRSKGLGGRTNIRMHKVVAKYLNEGNIVLGQLVHHIDHNKNNWSRDNIALCESNGEHTKLYHSVGDKNAHFGKLKGKSRICPVCGKEFYKPPSRDIEKTCSLACGLILHPQKDRLKKYYERRTAEKNFEFCEFCGKKFFASPAMHQKCCSRECSTKNRRLKRTNHKILSIKSIGYRETYQIEVADNHNYILANGLISKNCELRFLSLLSQDPVMLDVYRKGEDIHTRTGEAIVGKKKEEMTPEEFKDARQKAKCFHPDTEVLTKDGWIALKELNIDQEVMQAVPFDDNIILEWVLPTHLEIRKNHMDSLVHIHGRNIDIRVTPDHRMLIQRATKEFAVVEPKDFVKARYFWKAGKYTSNSFPLIDPRILKLAVATQADGSFQDNCIRFGFYKERKIVRLLSLLEEGEYSIALHKNGKNRPVTSINIKVPLAAQIKTLLDAQKCFKWDVLNWSFEDREMFIEEVSYWDACKTAGGPDYVLYTSSIKLNCDIIQAACAITGYSAKLVKGEYYQLSIQKKAKSRGDQAGSSKYSALKVEGEKYDGDVAVISVPSSFLLARSKEGEKRQATIITGQSANFGFIYGSGALTFQRVAKTDYGVELTEKEAQEFKDTFFNTYPTIHKYHYKVKAECHKDNGVMSPLGRFRHLPEMALDTKANEKNKEIQSIIHSAERQALNHAIQSVSSDAVLLSCLEIMKVVDPEECRPVLFIHDELTMEVLNSEIDKYAPIIKYHMINPPLKQFGVELNLPLDSDLMVGTNLAEMEEWKPKDKEATE